MTSCRYADIAARLVMPRLKTLIAGVEPNSREVRSACVCLSVHCVCARFLCVCIDTRTHEFL